MGLASRASLPLDGVLYLDLQMDTMSVKVTALLTCDGCGAVAQSQEYTLPSKAVGFYIPSMPPGWVRVWSNEKQTEIRHACSATCRTAIQAKLDAAQQTARNLVARVAPSEVEE